MGKSLRTALSLLAVMTVLLGLIYPALVWIAGQTLFPHEASGSLISYKGRAVGSALLGQNFTDTRFFWPRPSATPEHPYNALVSGASNLNPANPALLARITAHAAALKAAHKTEKSAIPADLVTTSGSGLDPHISYEAALYQAQRVAAARKIPRARIVALIDAHTEEPTFGFIGARRVNVLLLNIALEREDYR